MGVYSQKCKMSDDARFWFNLFNEHCYLGAGFLISLPFLAEVSGLFFLGHMSWAYVFAVAFAGKRGGKLFIPIILILSVLPDVDLFLGGFGVMHHTFTHSLFFWFVLFAPFLLVYRRLVIPYFVAVVQHFAFGDFFVGEVMLFLPFSSSYFGFKASMLSVFDVGLEITGLLLAAGIMYFNGDLKRLLSVDLRNVFVVFPFFALVSSMLFLLLMCLLFP